MPHSIHAKRLTPPRARGFTAAALLSGVLVAGCGGSSPSPTPAAGGATIPALTVAARAATTPGATTPTGEGATSSGSTAQATGASPLAFARCMRANGVPNFPDPRPGGGTEFPVPAGTSPAAPVFKAAQAKCQELLPGGGPPGPGTATNPSAQTLAKLLRIAVCMRQHGVPQFPDPRTLVPSNPSGIREITDFDGAILLFPSTMNLQAPAYRAALTACGAPPLGLRH